MTDPDLASPPAVIRRVAFLGTPPAAVPSLMALVEAGYDVPLVISRPDRRRGRGSKLIPSPVKQAARDLGLPVDDQPESLLSVEALDLAVVVAYGRILSRPLLERLPMVNVHFSLLPRWRGAAPVERAILAGDDVTGVSIIALSEGLDEGPVYDRLEVAVGPDETAAELTARLADTGADLLISVMRRGLSDPFPQQGEVTYAAKLDRSEYELDFGLRAADVHRRVRVGRAWTTFRGARLGIEETRVISRQGRPGRLELVQPDQCGSMVEGPNGLGPVVVVGTGEQSLVVISVKPEGRRTMSASEWWNGAQPQPEETLGR